MNDLRIKCYRFRAGSDLLASSAGLFDSYALWPIEGTLMGIQFTSNNYAATGSLFLTVSGTEDAIWSCISGTVTSNINVTGLITPVNLARDTKNNSGTNIGYIEMPIYGVMRLVGSGLGDSKSGTGFNVLYI